MQWSLENCLTVVALIGSATAWVWSAWYNALTLRQQHKASQWVRYERLVQTLHNGEDQGYWAQITALEEMKSFTEHRQLTLRLAKSARQYWSMSVSSSESKIDKRDVAKLILPDLDRVISELGG